MESLAWQLTILHLQSAVFSDTFMLSSCWMPVLHLASAVNRQYLLPLAVLLDAIRLQHPADLRIVFHLLHTNLQEEDLLRLSTLAELDIIHMSEARK